MRRIAIIFALCAFAAFSVPASLRSEIDAMNKKIITSQKKKNVDGFEKIVKGGVTLDFKDVENGVSMNFDQMVAQMSQGMTMLHSVSKVKVAIESINESGNSARMGSWHSVEGKMMGPDKMPQTLSFSGMSTDIYRKVGGKWKLASMKWSEQKMLVHGKPVDMSKVGG